MESVETKQSTGVAYKEQEGYFNKDRFVCFILLVCCLFYVGGPLKFEIPLFT